MSKKDNLTEGHIRGQIKGHLKPTEIQNGHSKPEIDCSKPSGAPPAPKPKEGK